MDISTPQNQSALHKYQKKHRWHRWVFVGVLFFLIILLSTLSYVIVRVAASDLGFSLTIVDGSGESEYQGNNSGGSTGSIGTYQAPLVPLIPPTQPAENTKDQVDSVDEAGNEFGDETQNNVLKIDSVVNIGDSQRNVPEFGTLISHQVQQYIPGITDKRPIFFGTVKEPHSLLRLELYTSEIFNTILEADDTGYWEWQAPFDLEFSEHLIVVNVFDPLGTQQLDQTVLRFVTSPVINPEIPVIRVPESSISDILNTNNGVDKETESVQILFDVRVLIPDTHRFVQPGEDVLAQIALINFTREAGAQDVTLYYTITDTNGEVVLEQSETVAVATQLSLVKHFRTSLAMEPGEYQLKIELPGGAVTAISSDSFVVGDAPVVVFPGGARTGVTLAFQSLVGLILLFLFILYFEFQRLDALGGMWRPITEEDLKKLGYIA